MSFAQLDEFAHAISDNEAAVQTHLRIGNNSNRWSIDAYLQQAHSEELGFRYHGERPGADLRATMPLSRSEATNFWIEVNSGRLRIIENGNSVEVRRRFDFTPGFEPQDSIDKYAEIIFTYPGEISSRTPNKALQGQLLGWADSRWR
ncbi:MAG: hypothetical protein HQ478_12215 [Chloroflexi bacterium]|nr:hypothetical protein [Chloroflexota bacterium]